MLRRLSILLPLVILVGALGLRAADPPVLERLRVLTFDQYQRVKPRPWTDADVRILDIDDASLERLGQWPWPRTLLAALVRRMGEAGAAAAVFDVVFPEPDRTSPARVLPLWIGAGADPGLAALAQQLPDHDRLFAAAIGANPVVLGMQLTDGRAAARPAVKWGIAVAGDDPRPFLPSFNAAVFNIAPLQGEAAGQGSFNSDIADADGIIRRVPLLFRLKGGVTVTDETYPSLAAEALRVVQGASTYILKMAGGSGEWSFGAHTGLTQVRIGAVTIPTDNFGRVWLYDTGFRPERVVPAWQVLAPGFDNARLEGKIVYIGTSASGLRDIRATPLSPSAAGVEVHAQITEQVILGQFLERQDWMNGAELVWLLAFGVLIAVLLPRWGAGACAAIALTGVGAAFGASWLAFAQFGWLVDPVYPSAAILLLYVSQSLLAYLRTERERRQVRGAMGLYVSPVLVERVAEDPSILQLGGETRPMTVMFCDIRGFTSVSETLDAQQLTKFLNEFLTPMTDIIFKHGGTIDKYMGDAIMAFWNAPLDDEDHAANASRAALEMMTRLPGLNASWDGQAKERGRTHRPVAIGIGLNTGPCCVGNMGSEQRFNYSVLGDAVNLASRLEGQSKTYGVPIVAGEATRVGAPALAWIELDLIRVKGKANAERVFALLGDETVATERWFVVAEAMQAEMLAAYRGRNWPRAAEMLAEVRAMAGDRLSTVCDIYADRIAACAAAPPDAAWDGVYQALQK